MAKILGLPLKEKYDFRADVLDIIIGGKSTLDSVNSFQVKSKEEADNFIQSYGYDLDNPIEKAEILGNYHEALNFIRKYFLQPESADGLRLEIPRKILELDDPRELFLLASHSPASHHQANDSQTTYARHWACSLLKVMHTIAHIDKDVRTPYFPDIQKQIFDRFYKLIHRDPDGLLFLGEKISDSNRINLVAFETKPKKSRNSIILKLLHKPENVAEDIFDRVGIRFVTPTPLGSLRVIKYLKDKMVIMPPNIKPSRSRNTLIQMDHFKNHLGDILEQAGKHELTEEDLLAKLEPIAIYPTVNPDNPHSSEFYRSIQFTCRQLIKLRNPIHDEFKDLKSAAKAKSTPDELSRMIDRIDLKQFPREIRFFYPFEVQVVDNLSAEENEKGKSAHSAYKRAQVLTAMKRVMGSLMDVAR